MTTLYMYYVLYSSADSVIIMDNPQFRKAKALDYEETASTDDDPSLNNEEPAVNRDTHS